MDDYGSDWDSFSSDFGGGYVDDASAWSMPSFSFDAPSMDFPVPTSLMQGTIAGGYPAVPGTMGSAPMGGGMTPNPQMGAPQQGWGQLMQPGNILGLLGGLAGLGGVLAGGGKGPTTTPQMSMEQRNVGHQTDTALHQLNPFVQGQSPLQQMQMSLLQALASGQGLPPGYAQLVEQAFQPQMGNIATQAIESARRRGFAGGAELLQQGPAGAIAGPMLADLQGQMAQAKLGLMQSLPGLYNQPINQQMGAAANQVQGYNNLMRSYPSGQTQSQPMAPQIGGMIGSGLQGLGQGMQQQQNQKQFYDMLMGLSGAPNS